MKTPAYLIPYLLKFAKWLLATYAQKSENTSRLSIEIHRRDYVCVSLYGAQSKSEGSSVKGSMTLHVVKIGEISLSTAYARAFMYAESIHSLTNIDFPTKEWCRERMLEMGEEIIVEQ